MLYAKCSILGRMTLSQYMKLRKLSLQQVWRDTRIAQSTLRRHVRNGKPLSREVAIKLEDYSKGAVSAVGAMQLPRTGPLLEEILAVLDAHPAARRVVVARAVALGLVEKQAPTRSRRAGRRAPAPAPT